ncbi:MAG: bifunctional phosphopantothenoylcysteine decarboxylase/phosphopantothenate--cysteine ligase CoaBC [Duncaniella sp.]|uniref:bifunctional phosphopantothenoylcysteine decarboxylase/phosphopantothenate--cysteine ligase CoaBC n=1 Tax=Duncaniella sp. TaxID=2518496 RepID=UPI0023D06A75|nr:bifunctional phosphopantothenoylcysteine decarboxylase/phosphopantothenate--cysteine ligase CoaBC [Duncaniella sp.]MDE6089692.1 bifunctional phosphopantothenoylcysteine decarboxylase/phosphopantothenate--cysteine ligase CoaBC [Duncaniella sp.]
MSTLSGKHIILGICGGIAAYKSVSLLRLLVKAGAEVQVVITPAGKQFITPVTLSSLSQKPVVSEFFTANTGEWHSHVDLGLWADCMVIAPATASTIGKMAHGIADNMLVTTYLSAKSQVFVAPAMDLDMMAHPSTTANIALLRSYGNIIIEPESGELASGLVGKGRMEEPEKIVAVLEEYFAKKADLKGKKVLITAGPTHEKIDPVRFIGNYSSGKMGYALAEECAARGAEVTLVSGPVSISISHPAVKVVKVESAREMLAACEEVFPESDVAVMCAAVADYAPAEVADRKIKREHSEVPEIRLVKNPDIAATLGQRKTAAQRLVGFALETDNELDNAQEKLVRKNLDMIVLNSMRDKGAGFGTDTNKISIIKGGGSRLDFGLKSKREVAADIVDAILDL